MTYLGNGSERDRERKIIRLSARAEMFMLICG
jgi:hypothetical protein